MCMCVCLRQFGYEQIRFRETLNKITNGTINEADYRLVSTRFHINNIVNHTFDNTICIMSKIRILKSLIAVS